MTKKIDVLWLVEHIAREMDVACAVRHFAKSRLDSEITVRHIYLHANQNIREFDPAVVVLPFIYDSSDLAIEDYVRAWPNATFFNMAWEEIHYKAHETPKAPHDEFAKKSVIHHAWGEFYERYLLIHGVPEGHIFVNGQPAYQLYSDPYNQYYRNRAALAQQYGLDRTAKWIFVPENYRWGFITEGRLNNYVNLGSDRDELIGLRDFCRESLRQLLRWCNETATERTEIEIVFRPRPTLSSNVLSDFFHEEVGDRATNLHFIKDESVREWILASDIIASSYSTSLIEAAIASKPVYMVEPVAIPDSLYSDWYDFVPRIRSAREFQDACRADAKVVDSKLRDWATTEMLSHGDPIQGLAQFIGELAARKRDVQTSFSRNRSSYPTRSRNPFVIPKYLLESIGLALSLPFSSHRAESLRRLRSRARSVYNLMTGTRPEKNYFNANTHENDVFDEEYIETVTRSWSEILDADLPAQKFATSRITPEISNIGPLEND